MNSIQNVRPMTNPNQNLPTNRTEVSSLQLAGGRMFMPTPQQWNQMREMGAAAFKSGMLPQGIKSAEGAAIVALKAYELGIPLMEGYAHIHVINGKPGLSREMMQTLIYQNIPGARIEILESTNKLARVKGTRPVHGSMTVEFTWEDAIKAQLTSKSIWQQYPKAMLLNRAMTALFRAHFPDGLRGCSYTPEELESSIETTGRTIEADTVPASTEPEKAPDPAPKEPAPAAPIPEPQPEPLPPAAEAKPVDIKPVFARASQAGIPEEELKKFLISIGVNRPSEFKAEHEGQCLNWIEETQKNQEKPIDVHPDFQAELDNMPDPRMVK